MFRVRGFTSDSDTGVGATFDDSSILEVLE